MRSSRQFSERVEQQFQQRANFFRSRLGKWSLWGSLAILGLVLLSAAWGDRRIYEAGPVAPVHRFIENDCAQCHDTWGPLSRLVRFDSQISSVSEAKCQACHLGSPHHHSTNAGTSKAAGHGQLGCASCHREHRHDQSLLKFANQECLNCHRELQEHGGSQQFAQQIGSFGAPKAANAHPEFALQRLLADKTATPISREAQQLLLDPSASTLAPPFNLSQPGDVAKIKFNHKKHLKAEYDAAGKLIAGIKGPNGELLDLSQDCAACHRPDATFSKMQPISYALHCQKCHTLSVAAGSQGEAAQPDERIEVPHRDIPTVLGHLTQQFTLRALAEQKVSPPAKPPARLFPGVTYQQSLNEEGATQVSQALTQATAELQSSVHSLLGKEAQGGCGYCHAVREKPGSSQADTDRIASLAERLEIVKPNIPNRWMAHANFSHDSHRFLNCQDCHRDFRAGATGLPVTESELTSDVLMPNIKVCQKCHSSRPAKLTGFTHLHEIQSAGTQCTLCHTYHDRTSERGSEIHLKPWFTRK